MSEDQLKDIADRANMVVNGYAFTCCEEDSIRVLNLNAPSRASLITDNGEVLETSMDDIEIAIIQGYLKRNQEFLTV